MVNHSTDPALRNTSLHRRESPAPVSEAGEGEAAKENGIPSASFFTLEAGTLTCSVVHLCTQLPTAKYMCTSSLLGVQDKHRTGQGLSFKLYNCTQGFEDSSFCENCFGLMQLWTLAAVLSSSTHMETSVMEVF